MRYCGRCYCGRCETKRATRRPADLPDIVAQDFGGLCDDCYGVLLEQAERMGVLS